MPEQKGPDLAGEAFTGEAFDREDLGFSKIRAKEKLYSNILIGVIGFVLVAASAGYWVKDSFARSEYDLAGNYPPSSDQAIYADYASFGGNDPAAVGGCGSSGGSGGGSCCGSGGGGLPSGVDLTELERLALEKFRQDTGNAEEVTAKAGDFGCHLQVDILDENNNIIRSYGYKGDSLYVIR